MGTDASQPRNLSDRFVSPLNFADGVRDAYSFAERILIADCTLRDGEGQPGVSFTFEEKVEVARLLDALGVAEIEAGRLAPDGADEAILRHLAGMGLGAGITAVCPPNPNLIERAPDLGVRGVLLFFANNLRKVGSDKAWSAEDQIDRAVKLCGQAKARGLQVVVSLSDIGRSDLEFALRFYRACIQAGVVDRIRVADSCGSMVPPSVRYLMGELRRNLPKVPVEIHCHNDHGLAVANTLAAAETGATVLSTSMNGLGERSGNAATEEVAAALAFLYGVETSLDLGRLSELSSYVERASGVGLQPHKAVVGRNSFAFESDSMVSDVVRDPLLRLCYAPELVGQTARIVLGVKTGPVSVQHALKKAGLAAEQPTVEDLVRKVRAQALRQKSPVSDCQFVAMAREVLEKS